MKHRLRLALPPLDQLTPDSRIPYALLDRNGQPRASGEQVPARLAALVRGGHALAILHPGEAVVTRVDLPPLPSRRLDAAVHGRVEPMILGEIEGLCIAHGPQAADGGIQVAWVGRAALLRGWRVLHEAGLKLDAIVPFELALPENDPRPDMPLALPADARWLAPLPAWSLARPEWRPARPAQRWRLPLIWAAAAVLLWVAGLNLYAAQLRNEAQALRAGAEQAVRTAFPAIAAVLDPLRQARGQRDMLRAAHGMAGHDDFMPLALDAARVLNFAAGHVSVLSYGEGRLTLVLAEGYVPPADETGLRQAAAAESLTLQKDAGQAHTWHVRRIDAPAGREARP